VRWLTICGCTLALIVVTVVFLGSGGEARAATGVAAGDYLDSDTLLLDTTVTTTLTTTVYLPFVCHTIPVVVQVPEGEYLFVESWTHSMLGAGCEGLCVDFPGYSFDVQGGELDVYTTDPPDPALVLGEYEVGFVGSGVSMGGAGCGVSSSLDKIERCPWSQDGVELYSVDDAGVVTLKRQGETIVLEPGGVWTGEEETETWDWLGAGCIVTSTHSINNYGFQDRDKITYRNLFAGHSPAAHVQ
jgi:hypothetical protein